MARSLSRTTSGNWYDVRTGRMINQQKLKVGTEKPYDNRNAKDILTLRLKSAKPWPATIQHFHAVQAGYQGLSCSWAKTESRPSTSRPRRRRRDRLRAIPTIEIREKIFTTQPSTFDLLLYIVTRSNTYPRLEERAGRKYKGEKGGLWLWSMRRTGRILVRQEREP